MYRYKGILSVNGSDERYVLQVPGLIPALLFNSFLVTISQILILRFLVFFQGVHTILNGCPGKTWAPDEKRINKLVFIGRDLDEAILRKGFKGCLV